MINKNWVSWCWQLGVFGAVVAGAIASGFEYAQAQSIIVPDGTLGAESSVVLPYNGLPVEVINGGAIRGSNLFHSFREFNVSSGRGVYFFSPNVNIQNILARVTGSNHSEILGTLGTYGNSNPNLFLINPNGIIFGPNASLDVGGSFVATTANAVLLGNNGIFSASEPAKSNLLSVNPSALLFNAISGQGIVNKSTATQTVLGDDTYGLQVPNGRSLLLVGGDVQLDGGNLFVQDGRVELGGLAGNGTVGLNIDGNSLSLSFPQQVQLADVSLTNGSLISVPASDGSSTGINASNQDIIGGINITARSFALTNGAQLQTYTAGQGNAASITIDAPDTVKLDGVTSDGSSPSAVFSGVLEGAKGLGGNINITTGSLKVTNGARLTTRTFGQGNAGSITINARDGVSLDGEIDNKFVSSVFSDVLKTDAGAVGNGGNINITTGSLALTKGAQLYTSTAEQGNAGSITINARDTVSLDGGSVFSNASAVGNGGDINITTGSLALINGASLNTITGGQGDAGSITINARDSVSSDGSAVGSSVLGGAIGLGGNINITTGSVALTNGAGLGTFTNGQGDAGSITINARDQVSLDGVGISSNSEPSPSGVLSSTTAFGKGGDINITTGSLTVSNGAEVGTSTDGQGNAGSITIHAHDTVNLDGSLSLPSSVGSDVLEAAFGNGGNINITTGSLTVRNGAGLSTSTFRQGNAGSITINARDRVSLDGKSSVYSGVFSDVSSNVFGNGGDIKITAGSLAVTNDALLDTITFGLGNPGSITINARDTVTFDSGSAVSGVDTTGVFRSSGGDINITAGSLTVRNGAQLNTVTFSQRSAGSVTINARDTVTLDGGFVKSDTLSTTSGSRGGNVNITTGSLALINGAQLTANTEGQANAGNVTINAHDTVTFDGKGSDDSPSGAFSRVNSTGVGNGGTINITTGTLTLTNGAQLSVRTEGQGNAGNVKINARDTVTFDGKFVTSEGLISHSGVSSQVNSPGVGNGGTIDITTGSLTVRNGAQLSALTEGQGNAGSVTVDTRDTLQLNNAQITTNSTSSNGGDITLTAKDIRLRNNSLIRTDLSSGQGSGGNITLTANTILALEDSDILAFASQGRGGNITFNTRAFLSDPLYRPSGPTTDPVTFDSLRNNGRVDVNASGAVSGGNITGVPDPSFIQNSLTELPQNLINPNVLIANSCIARSSKLQGTFTITGAGGLPNRPGDAVLSTYPTGDVRSVPSSAASRPWHKGDPIVEPQGLYLLPSGQLILSRECSK